MRVFAITLLVVALVATAFYAVDIRAKNLDMLLSTNALASQVEVLTGVTVERSREMTCLQARLDQAVTEADANLMRVTSGFHVQEMELVEKCRVMTQHVACMEVLLTETEANLTRLTSGFHVRETELVEKCRVLTQHVVDMERELDRLSLNQLPPTFIEAQRPGAITQYFTRGDFTYQMTTTNFLTENEGFYGILTRDGKTLTGPDTWGVTRPTIETPWGHMTWYGNPDDRKHPWDVCGWIIVLDDNKEVASW